MYISKEILEINPKRYIYFSSMKVIELMNTQKNTAVLNAESIQIILRTILFPIAVTEHILYVPADAVSKMNAYAGLMFLAIFIFSCF
jgi:hypothetical protein